MYCEKCGKQLPDDSGYCPNCGAKIGYRPINIKRTNSSLQRDIHRQIFMVFIVIVVVAIIYHIWMGKRLDKQKKEVIISSTVLSETKVEAQEKEDAISIIGVWKCKQGEVTFTENGNMMLGKDGIVLGGGWVQYEVVDDKNLYISGGNIPLGMNIKYSLSSKYLTLELSSGNISFTKE